MMGADISISDYDLAINIAAVRAMVAEAARLRAQLCASRGLTPSQACNVGCKTCGVIDASPARCEQCTGAHTAGERSGCWCGPGGCADSACPGRTA